MDSVSTGVDSVSLVLTVFLLVLTVFLLVLTEFLLVLMMFIRLWASPKGTGSTFNDASGAAISGRGHGISICS